MEIAPVKWMGHTHNWKPMNEKPWHHIGFSWFFQKLRMLEFSLEFDKLVDGLQFTELTPSLSLISVLNSYDRVYVFHTFSLYSIIIVRNNILNIYIYSIIFIIISIYIYSSFTFYSFFMFIPIPPARRRWWWRWMRVVPARSNANDLQFEGALAYKQWVLGDTRDVLLGTITMGKP